MTNPDLALYVVHAGFWTTFGIAHVVSSRRNMPPDSSPAPAATGERTASFSRAVLAVHFGAFGLMYFGMGNTIIPNRVPQWFPGQRLVGLTIIAAGAALMSWARVWFHSWRFRAKLDAGHQLATGGPFRLMRHPIYMGLNLLALGTAVWVPTPAVWIAFALMVIGSDLRGHAEERVLASAFGSPYVEYCARTRRFLPGMY